MWYNIHVVLDYFVFLFGVWFWDEIHALMMGRRKSGGGGVLKVHVWGVSGVRVRGVVANAQRGGNGDDCNPQRWSYFGEEKWKE